MGKVPQLLSFYTPSADWNAVQFSSSSVIEVGPKGISWKHEGILTVDEKEDNSELLDTTQHPATTRVNWRPVSRVFSSGADLSI